MNQPVSTGKTSFIFLYRLAIQSLLTLPDLRRHLRSGRILHRTFILIMLNFCTLTAHAFEQLSDVQNLIYGRPHLSTTVAGQSIAYQYSSQVDSEPPVHDKATLSVAKSYADDKRDVVLDFLSSERHIALPDFTQYQGNPIIIAMLEHIAQNMGNETGGGALYFRNRIRDSLASTDAVIEQKKLPFDGGEIETTVLTLSPFLGDTYLIEQPRYTQAVISITLSDDVPGGVVGIGVKSEYNGELFYRHALSLDPGKG